MFLVGTLTCKREVVKPNIAVAIPARCMTERSSPFQLLLRAATSATAGVRAWRAALVLLIAAIRVLALMPVPPPGLDIGWDELNLETAVGRARVGGDAVRWQGVAQACPAPCLGLKLRAPARKEEQRRQRDAALLNRVRSGVTHEVT